MAIATTIDLIQNVNRAISGVRTCPTLARYPLKADTADLPLVLTIPAEGTFHHKGMGGSLKRQDRIYKIIAFVEPTGQNQFPVRAKETADLLQAFITTWLTVGITDGEPIALADPPTYQVTIEDSESAPHSDTGIDPNLTIGGVTYHGFTISLRVRELW